MVWIFDRWTEADKAAYVTLFESGEQTAVISLEDDGFLPEGAVSPYRCCVQEALGARMEDMEENPLFADFLEVPELWEIRMHYAQAEIWDDGIKKAEIVYAEPTGRHNTKCVRWMGRDGLPYQADHYDKYGKLYYTELLDTEGHADVRTYFAGKEPVLMFHPKFDTYFRFGKGKVCEICSSTQEFLKRFLSRNFPGERDILSNNIKLLETLADVGEPSSRINGNVMILTNSDRIVHLEKLVSALPVLHFHIGAKTAMSDKLHRLEEYPNVTLYPGMSAQKRAELLIKSTYYLDINYFQEVDDAVYAASRYGLLVAGFDNTLHHKNLLLPECVFEPEDPERMIRFLETVYWNQDILKSMVKRQRKLLSK